MSEEASSLAAGREVLEKIGLYLETRVSFAVETTLSGKNYLRVMAEAHQKEFQVVLVYIGTENVEINLARIASRVLSGGHNVPEHDVRRRYTRSFQHLPQAIALSDAIVLFDNSTDQSYQLVAVGEKNFEWLEPLPQWAGALRRHLE